MCVPPCICMPFVCCRVSICVHVHMYVCVHLIPVWVCVYSYQHVYQSTYIFVCVCVNLLGCVYVVTLKHNSRLEYHKHVPTSVTSSTVFITYSFFVDSLGMPLGVYLVLLCQCICNRTSVSFVHKLPERHRWS